MILSVMSYLGGRRAREEGKRKRERGGKKGKEERAKERTIYLFLDAGSVSLSSPISAVHIMWVVFLNENNKPYYYHGVCVCVCVCVKLYKTEHLSF